MSAPGPYAKPALTFEQQIALIQSRGLSVPDVDDARTWLERVGYYRLSGYWLPFKHDGESLAGGSFPEVIRLYEFDRRLRLLLMDAIERVEVVFRTAIAYRLGHAFGAFAHEATSSFRTDFGDPPNPGRSRPPLTHASWLSDLKVEIERSREQFIDSHRAKYTSYPSLPIWIAAEVMTFGTMSKLYRAMLPDQQRAVIAEYSIHHSVAYSWLHTLSYVRNACAHHSRLWNRELPLPPKLPRGDSDWNSAKYTSDRRIYVAILILRFLTRQHPNGEAWACEICRLLRTWEGQVRWQRAMGVPLDWHDHPFWKGCP